MITLGSSQKSLPPNISAGSVGLSWMHLSILAIEEANDGIVSLTCYLKFENALLLVQMSENYLKIYAL